MITNTQYNTHLHSLRNISYLPKRPSLRSPQQPQVCPLLQLEVTAELDSWYSMAAGYHGNILLHLWWYSIWFPHALLYFSHLCFRQRWCFSEVMVNWVVPTANNAIDRTDWCFSKFLVQCNPYEFSSLWQVPLPKSTSTRGILRHESR